MNVAPSGHGEFVIRVAGASDAGSKRGHNEDVAVVREDLALFAVIDGAGGHDAGDVAAATAARVMTEHVVRTHKTTGPAFDRFGLAIDARRIGTALHAANTAVLELSRALGSKKGMGAVVVAVLFSPRAALMHVAHAGDSRCYRLRLGNLEQLTQDHSVINDVIEQRPDVDSEMLSRLPRKAVTRALGIDEDIRIPLRSYEVVDGDRFLLCSDGLTGPVRTRALSEILGRGLSPDETVAALIDAAKAGGAPDNVTAIVIDCGSPRHAALPITSVPPGAPGDSRDSQPELLILAVEEVNADLSAITDDDELAKLLSGLLKNK